MWEALFFVLIVRSLGPSGTCRNTTSIVFAGYWRIYSLALNRSPNSFSMPIIQQDLWIDAPIERAFDLARSIDLHQVSTAQTKERAIAGRTSGLIELGETVTWRAKHLGIYQNLTVRITEMERPHFFVDEMVRGAFQGFRHQHIFEERNGLTRMTDIFDYRSPLGWLGHLADWLFLEEYMRHFLAQRNQVIKECAEGEQWRQVLSGNHKGL